MRQQRLVAAGFLLQPLMAALGVFAVTGQMPLEVSMSDVVELSAGNVWAIERDLHFLCLFFRKVSGKLH